MFDGAWNDNDNDQPKSCHVCGCINYHDEWEHGPGLWPDAELHRVFVCGQRITYKYHDPMIITPCRGGEPATPKPATLKSKLRKWWGAI